MKPEGIESVRVAFDRGQIEEREELRIEQGTQPKAGEPVVSPAELAEAKKNQLAALKQLRLWYNDWATTFRGPDGFTLREQITLGLTSPKRRKAAEGEEGEAEREEAEAEEEETEVEEQEAEEGEAEG